MANKAEHLRTEEEERQEGRRKLDEEIKRRVIPELREWHSSQGATGSLGSRAWIVNLEKGKKIRYPIGCGSPLLDSLKEIDVFAKEKDFFVQATYFENTNGETAGSGFLHIGVNLNKSYQAMTRIEYPEPMRGAEGA